MMNVQSRGPRLTQKQRNSGREGAPSLVHSESGSSGGPSRLKVWTGNAMIWATAAMSEAQVARTATAAA